MLERHVAATQRVVGRGKPVFILRIDIDAEVDQRRHRFFVTGSGGVVKCRVLAPYKPALYLPR